MNAISFLVTLLLTQQLPTPAAPHPAGAQAVQAVVQSAIEKGTIPGAVVYVAQAGQPLVFEALGAADPDRKLTRDTLFRIASMTKPITSVAVMMLVEDGRIRLDDPLSHYLPEFAGLGVIDAKTGTVSPPARAVTIRDMLTQTSGIAYGLNPPEALKQSFAAARLADGLNPEDPTLEENTKKLATLPLAHQPGTAWTYGMNTDALGRVVEVTSGMPLDRFFRERIFLPLNMKDTSFRVTSDQAGRLARLHTPGADHKVRPLARDPETFGIVTIAPSRPTAAMTYLSGGAGLVSTAGDYARFLQMLLNEGELDGARLLRADTVRQMTRNQIGALNCAYAIHGEKFGFGFGVVEQPGATASVGSYSWGGMYHTFFWVDPSRKLVAVLMTQLYPWGASTLWADFQKAVYASLGEKPASRLTLTECTLHGDLDCFRIQTPHGTYLYGKQGAGFASLIDADGNDWISYAPGNKARGEYRGLPKCGQPTKFFHCGYGSGPYKTSNVFTSTVTVEKPDHIRILSITLDAKTACTWDFFNTHATMTLLKIAAPTYWFLYEGTPGGKLEAGKDFVIRPDGQKTTLDQPWSQVVPWVCVGASESRRGLVCVSHQRPEAGQTDSYVSWPFEKDRDGQFQEMTVFGFGRKGYKELVQHIPDLTVLPARFSIALIPSADHPSARALAESILAGDAK